MVVHLPTSLPIAADLLAHAMLSSVVNVTVATLAVSLTAETLVDLAAKCVVLLVFATSSKLVNAKEVILADILMIPTRSFLLHKTLVPNCVLLFRKVNALVVISADTLMRWRVIK
jgi:hypothetical protein